MTSAAINLGKFTSEKFGSFGPYNKKTVHSDEWLVKLGSNILIPFSPHMVICLEMLVEAL